MRANISAPSRCSTRPSSAGGAEKSSLTGETMPASSLRSSAQASSGREPIERLVNVLEALDLGTQGAQLLALFLETRTTVVMDAHAAVDIGFGGQRICLQLRELHLEILQMAASGGKRRLRGDMRILDPARCD